MIMVALAGAFLEETRREGTLLRPGTRIDAVKIQALLEHVLGKVLLERERPYFIGSIDEMRRIGYDFSDEERGGGRDLYARDVGINLDEVTLRREHSVQWQLVLHGRFWR